MLSFLFVIMKDSSSPRTDPVDLRECIEYALKFTLESHIKGTLELDLSLSKDFCSLLLKDCNTGCFDQDFQYPPYKTLASSICKFVPSGGFHGSENKVASFKEDEESKQKQRWLDLTFETGYDIANILKSINFELHVQEPFFTQLKDCSKTVEGRCAIGDYNRIESGDFILFNKCLVLEVQDVHRYSSFCEMLESEGLAKVLPGVETINKGVEVYRKFYTEEKEKSNGVVAICVAKSSTQPYSLLGKTLSSLTSGLNTQRELRKKKSELVSFRSASSPPVQANV